MGAVNFSIDKKLLDIFVKNIELDVFIETGTFQGDTIESAKPYFNEIYSIEFSPDYFKKAKERFSKNKNITLLQGNSPEELNKLKDTISHRNVIYWLDAHWCVAENTAGESSQCPLAEELDAIGKLNENSVIIIDDARFFLAPPTYPHVIAQWPNFSTIIQKLQALSNQHDFRVINDCIIYFPHRLSKAIDDYGYHHGVDWNHIFQKASRLEESEADRAARLVVINALNAKIQTLESALAKKSIFLSLILVATKQIRAALRKIVLQLRKA